MYKKLVQEYTNYYANRVSPYDFRANRYTEYLEKTALSAQIAEQMLKFVDHNVLIESYEKDYKNLSPYLWKPADYIKLIAKAGAYRLLRDWHQVVARRFKAESNDTKFKEHFENAGSYLEREIAIVPEIWKLEPPSNTDAGDKMLWLYTWASNAFRIAGNSQKAEEHLDAAKAAHLLEWDGSKLIKRESNKPS